MRESATRTLWTIRKAILLIQGNRRVALASFPRSGNTWVRFMIEEATGELSGSVYNDRIMPRGREGVVIKTHELDSHRYTQAIHLLRNPFDTIESYFHWKRNVAGNDRISWDEHVKQSVLEWRVHTQHWLNTKCPVYRVRYEDFHKDTMNQLRSLLLWLSYDLTQEQLVTVVAASSVGKMRERNPGLGSRFFRRGQVGRGIDRFTNEQGRFVIDSLQDLLKVCGYEELLQV